MEKTFEDKVAVVASAYYNRYEEGEASEILQKIFENQDMAGPLALSLLNEDIELKTDTAKAFIEDTFEIINNVFELPDEIEAEISSI